MLLPTVSFWSERKVTEQQWVMAKEQGEYSATNKMLFWLTAPFLGPLSVPTLVVASDLGSHGTLCLSVPLALSLCMTEQSPDIWSEF